MSISAVYMLDSRGKVLISRNYRGDVPFEMIEKFMSILVEKEEDGYHVPVIQKNSCTFSYITYNNIYIVSTTKKNSNVALIFVFLQKLLQIMLEYFREFEEESIRDNFILIYELMDEVLDFGFPQTTDVKILREYVTQEGHKLVSLSKVPTAVTNAVSWRSEGIKYKKNEVFLDVFENVDLLANANGVVLNSEVIGCVKMRVHLSGMPELRLGLNDKILFENTGKDTTNAVELENVKFHQCVRLSRFENDRTICFTPPDGEFELMSYRLGATRKPLVWVECFVEHHRHSRIEFTVKVASQFRRRSSANNVEVMIPVPTDVSTPVFKSSIGNVFYDPIGNTTVWQIKSLQGAKEFSMRASFALPSVDKEALDQKRPIRVKFEIPYFTTSGLQVRYLKIIEKSQYPALPWVRYVTQSGNYEIRVNEH